MMLLRQSRTTWTASGAGWLLWMFVFSSWNGSNSHHNAVQAQSTGLQTPLHTAVTYAGGVAYDSVGDRLYVTGQTGPNQCFVGVLDASQMQFLSQVILDQPAICQRIAIMNDPTTGSSSSSTGSGSSVMMVATTEEEGLYTNLRQPGSTKSQQYGVVVPLHLASNGQRAQLSPSGLLLHQDAVQYPKAILKDPTRPEIMYIAVLQSLSSELTAEFKNANVAVPNQTPSGQGHSKYGKHWYLQLERIHTNSVPAPTHEWRKPFGIHASDTPTDVDLSALLWNQNALLLVGHTPGSGLLFGENPNDGLMAGYLAKLDPTNGQLWTGNGRNTNSVRYNMNNEAQETYIWGACSSGSDANVVYIVGHYVVPTTGKHVAFLTQLNADTLQPIWEQDYVGFSTNAHAAACTVEADESSVYLAGVVSKDGSYNNGETVSLGGDDIFVLKAEAPDGHLQWIRQFGSQHDESLVHQDGIVLTTTTANNKNQLLLVGNTQGDLYNFHTQDSELFIASIDAATGTVGPTTETSGTTHDGGNLTPIIPTLSGEEDNDEPVVDDAPTTTTQDDPCTETLDNGHVIVHQNCEENAPTTTTPPDCDEEVLDNGHVVVHGNGCADPPPKVPDCDEEVLDNGHVVVHGNGCADPKPKETKPPTTTTSSNQNSSNSLAPEEATPSGLGKYLGIALLVVVLCCGYCLRCRKEETTTERSTVFSYLHAFDLEDIEVRHSATGGWHGTYVGDLAKGKGARTMADTISTGSGFSMGSSGSGAGASQSHSSVVKDSLFLDYEAQPTSRYRDEDHSDEEYDNDDDDFENAARLAIGRGDDGSGNTWGREIL